MIKIPFCSLGYRLPWLNVGIYFDIVRLFRKIMEGKCHQAFQHIFLLNCHSTKVIIRSSSIFMPVFRRCFTHFSRKLLDEIGIVLKSNGFRDFRKAEIGVGERITGDF